MSSPTIRDNHFNALSEVYRKAGSAKMVDEAMDYLGYDKDLDQYNASQIKSLLWVIDKLKAKSKVYE